MVKDNQKRLNRMRVLLDILATAVAYALAWFIVISGKMPPLDGGVLKLQVYFMALTFIVPIYLTLYASFHLHAPKRIQGRCSELANVCKANTIGLMLFTFTLFGLRGFVGHLSYSSTEMTLAFFAANIILLETERTSTCIFLHPLWTNGHNQKHVFLIGYSRAAEGFIDRVSVNPEWGYHVQGILDDYRLAGFAHKRVRVLGPTNHLEDFLAFNTPDEAAMTLSIKEYSSLEQIVVAREKSGVHTKFTPDYNNIIPTTPYMEGLQGLPVICIRHVPLTGVFDATMKRVVNLAGALFGPIVFSLLTLVTALLIKITSPGLMLFSQERIGLHNRPFKMYKFRSTEVQNPGGERSQWTMPHDPRVTPAGRFIRKTSIDEMPQFFNALIGDMGLAGFRPEWPLLMERFKEETSRYMIKYQVRPGLTGRAQVNGYRGDISIIRRIEHNLYYIESWSLGFGFKIMFLVVLEGFINRSAY